MPTKPEKKLIKTINKLMAGQWEASPVENFRGSGFSDYVNSCHGRHVFIEYKHVEEWPKRPDTIIKVDHFTKYQKIFLYRHGKHGNGGAFLCLQVGQDILWFNYKQAQKVGKMDKGDMIMLCCDMFKLPFYKDETEAIKQSIIEILTTR